MIAHVVPLRRFDATHWWFDYTIPDELSVQVGQIVTVPFRHRPLPGLVWSIGDQSTKRKLLSVQAVATPEPIVTDWQRRVMEVIALQTCSSLGHVVQRFVPPVPKRKTKSRQIPFHLPKVQRVKHPSPFDGYHWYRKRSDAVETILSWLAESDARVRCVIVPTIEDGLELQAAIQKHGGQIPFVSSDLTPATYRAIYYAVRTETLPRLIATSVGIGLPYATPPLFLIDQEEHPAHKLVHQQPRFDVREVLREIAPPQITTPAPSVRWFRDSSSATPNGPPASPRRVWSLQQPSDAPWISYDAQQQLADATPTQPILAIAPQIGFASLMRCKECGYIRSCPWCGASVRFFSARGQVGICRACQKTLPDMLRCPTCRSTRWSLIGLGVERAEEMLTTLFPKLHVGPATTGQTSLTVGTYNDIRTIPPHPWSVIVILSGDSLLQWPDFAAPERAWQFLHRVQATHPSALLAVQTFNPELPFWQRWQDGQDRAWYEAEIQTRRRLGLPPFREHWVARRPKQGSGPSIASVKDRLTRLGVPGLRVELTSNQMHAGHATDRLVISGPGQPLLRSLLPWQDLFPYPWQVDTRPNSWLL